MGLRITANFALSADGKISTRGPGGSGFGSAEDHRRLLALRAEADAVLVGQATLVADRMSLGLGSTREWRDQRLAAGRPEFPARVVAGGRCPIAPDHPVFSATAGPLHFLLPPGHEGGGVREDVRWHQVTEKDAPDLCARIISLARSEGWRHIHCEGGARIFHLLARSGLVNTLYLTLVPVVFGGHAAPRLLPRDADWAASVAFHLDSVEPAGDELFLRYERVKNP
jgi:5-amino-6-(5-phosphoribosylamino)uracil reductase/2,5-diamino-6-(ribosylamino)-4(3H)-pyrimidinone 5'-phosphate reductase